MSDPAQPYSQELFYWKDIAIEQDDRVWKAGTDAILLGTWIPKIIHTANSILDIGTGSGILLLMLSKSYAHAGLMGIDNYQPAVDLAQRNADRSFWKDRIQIEHSSLEDFSKDKQGRFDLIVSNPPFFNEEVKSTSAQRLVSKHTDIKSVDWVSHMKTLLSEEGSICLILPDQEMKDWIKAANDAGLYISHRLNVYTFKANTQPKRVLVRLTNNLVKIRIEEMVMLEHGNTPTTTYAAWLQA